MSNRGISREYHQGRSDRQLAAQHKFAGPIGTMFLIVFLVIVILGLVG